MKAVYACLLWACVFVPCAHAAEYGLNDWQNPAPHGLEPFSGNAAALADLAADTVAVYPHAPRDFTLEVKGKLKKYRNQQFVSAALVLPVSAATVAQTVRHYPGYAGFLPKTTLSRLKQQSGPHSLMQYHVRIDLPMPFPNVSEDILAQHTVEPDGSVSARLIDAPMDIGLARYQWFPIDAQHTLLVFTTWTDLSSATFLLRTIMRAFPDIRFAIPYVGNGFLAEAFRNRLAPASSPNPATLPAIPPAKEMVWTPERKQVLSRLLAHGETAFIHPPVWIRGANDQPVDLRFITAIGQVHAPVDSTRQLTTDFARYPKIFPQVRKVRIQQTQGSGFNMDMKLGIGLGFLSLPVNLSIAHTWGKDRTLYYKSFAGDVEHIQGQWHWEEAAGNSTWMHLHSAGEVGEHPPHVLKLAKYLPYNDFLPTLGAQVISLRKLEHWVERQQPGAVQPEEPLPE
ncbi:MAG: SRPBCC family protein [Fluviicoccus sp.]|uniref:SRPBCC family protein n=1 Tax=Fluviicoccus sp. TaxID=2003552 RepID=UPI002723E3A4|nr:SRPBCC family protein [Fluviicoccus sp.]MDO8329014.1 SRPBCC family protein [Fluviicoccus sp.]